LPLIINTLLAVSAAGAVNTAPAPEQVERWNGSEIGALFSPSGHSLMFARDTGEPLSGEFFIWRLDGHEAWPPACP